MKESIINAINNKDKKRVMKALKVFNYCFGKSYQNIMEDLDKVHCFSQDELNDGNQLWAMSKEIIKLALKEKKED